VISNETALYLGGKFEELIWPENGDCEQLRNPGWVNGGARDEIEPPPNLLSCFL